MPTKKKKGGARVVTTVLTYESPNKAPPIYEKRPKVRYAEPKYDTKNIKEMMDEFEHLWHAADQA